MLDTLSRRSQTVAPVSRALFLVDTSDGPWIEAGTGSLVARTGQRGVWSRSATLASVAAANGAYTAEQTVPAWELRDGVLGLRHATTDALAFPINFGPMALSGAFSIVELGARMTANSTLWALRNDAASGAGLWLDTSGTYYRMNYSDGTTTRTATLTVGQPTSGQRVLFSWSLSDTGVLNFAQSINEAPPTTAAAAALALPPNWATGAQVRIGRRGSSANPAALWWRRLVLAEGVLSAADLQEYW